MIDDSESFERGLGDVAKKAKDKVGEAVDKAKDTLGKAKEDLAKRARSRLIPDPKGSAETPTSGDQSRSQAKSPSDPQPPAPTVSDGSPPTNTDIKDPKSVLGEGEGKGAYEVPDASGSPTETPKDDQGKPQVSSDIKGVKAQEYEANQQSETGAKAKANAAPNQSANLMSAGYDINSLKGTDEEAGNRELLAIGSEVGDVMGGIAGGLQVARDVTRTALNPSATGLNELDTVVSATGKAGDVMSKTARDMTKTGKEANDRDANAVKANMDKQFKELVANVGGGKPIDEFTDGELEDLSKVVDTAWGTQNRVRFDKMKPETEKALKEGYKEAMGSIRNEYKRRATDNTTEAQKLRHEERDLRRRVNDRRIDISRQWRTMQNDDDPQAIMYDTMVNELGMSEDKAAETIATDVNKAYNAVLNHTNTKFRRVRDAKESGGDYWDPEKEAALAQLSPNDPQYQTMVDERDRAIKAGTCLTDKDIDNMDIINANKAKYERSAKDNLHTARVNNALKDLNLDPDSPIGQSLAGLAISNPTKYHRTIDALKRWDNDAWAAAMDVLPKNEWDKLTRNFINDMSKDVETYARSNDPDATSLRMICNFLTLNERSLDKLMDAYEDATGKKARGMFGMPTGSFGSYPGEPQWDDSFIGWLMSHSTTDPLDNKKSVVTVNGVDIGRYTNSNDSRVSGNDFYKGAFTLFAPRMMEDIFAKLDDPSQLSSFERKLFNSTMQVNAFDMADLRNKIFAKAKKAGHNGTVNLKIADVDESVLSDITKAIEGAGGTVKMVAEGKNGMIGSAPINVIQGYVNRLESRANKLVQDSMTNGTPLTSNDPKNLTEYDKVRKESDAIMKALCDSMGIDPPFSKDASYTSDGVTGQPVQRNNLTTIANLQFMMMQMMASNYDGGGQSGTQGQNGAQQVPATFFTNPWYTGNGKGQKQIVNNVINGLRNGKASDATKMVKMFQEVAKHAKKTGDYSILNKMLNSKNIPKVFNKMSSEINKAITANNMAPMTKKNKDSLIRALDNLENLLDFAGANYNKVVFTKKVASNKAIINKLRIAVKYIPVKK